MGPVVIKAFLVSNLSCCARSLHTQFEKIHSQELTKLRQKQKEAVTAMTELHNEVRTVKVNV